ncbi:hypothetical protein NC653_002091 [Populus alba x Populus x berolinensis]|uniref:Uncharacterized protein n=1 Tax=Populus alba x Populus x berolinensis TaxID=444605 RepID=A0AAD6WGD8_9ROSI|nr:hypothetical protein NC653_002091 [Populus alba x Populus x berolinensis]
MKKVQNDYQPNLVFYPKFEDPRVTRPIKYMSTFRYVNRLDISHRCVVRRCFCPQAQPSGNEVATSKITHSVKCKNKS